MKRILTVLAMLACIGSTVTAQTFRPLTGTRLLLNSAFPSGGSLTLQASPGADYSITLPATAPAANTILANGSTAGTTEWLSPLDMYVFENGLSETGSNTVELGGSLTKNTTIDLDNRTLTLSSSSTDGNVEISTSGAFSLTSSGLNISSAGVISATAGDVSVLGNLVSTTNNNYDLGSDAIRWKTAYLASTGLHIGSSYGTNEVLIGYSGGGAYGTGYITVDGSGSLITLHRQDGIVLNSDVVVGKDDASILRFPGTIHSQVGTTDGTALVFEGHTVDLNQTTFKIENPTADRVIRFPDESGMVALTQLDGSVVIVGKLTVNDESLLKGLVTIGTGEPTDVLTINTGNKPDLQIDETSLRVAGEVTLEGRNPTDASQVSSVQLGENLSLFSDNSLQGNFGGDIKLIGDGYLQFSTKTDFGDVDEALLYVDDGSVELKIDNPTNDFYSKLLMDGAQDGMLSMTTKDLVSLNEVTFFMDPNDGFTFYGAIKLDGLAGTANTSLGSNDRVVVANSDGTLDQIAVANLIGDAAWVTSGNSITDPTTQFLGTTSAQPLRIVTNSTEAMRVSETGSLLVGTTSGTETLVVNGSVNLSGGAVDINATGSSATTIGNTDATTSVLGGLKVSTKVVNVAAGTDYTIANETVVIVTGLDAADKLILPAHDEGRIVIIRNNQATTIDVYLNDGTTFYQDDLGGNIVRTLVSVGGTWYQIGQ